MRILGFLFTASIVTASTLLTQPPLLWAIESTTDQIVSEWAAKQEIAKTVRENMEELYKGHSLAGKAVDLAKSFLPGYSWYKTYNVVEGTPTGAHLQGSNWAEQIAHLYVLQPWEMNLKLRSAVYNLSDDDPTLALQFANAVVSYSSIDELTTNTTSVGLLFIWAAIFAKASTNPHILKTLNPVLLRATLASRRALGSWDHTHPSSHNLLKFALPLLLIILAWMFAYETNPSGYTHRNRITGAVCSFDVNCW